ncbi:MAG: hypothetical protein KY469_10830 [Actinobacteria bacterium]|nr:hypothetical protein [Actinomycetota bacterium]
MALTVVTVTGTYLERATGEAASGSVSFKLSGAMADSADDKIVAPRTISADLDENGHISVDLYATDDPGIQPQGRVYTVTERIVGSPIRIYTIDVPHGAAGAAGATIDLADAIPVDGTTATYVLTAAVVTFDPSGLAVVTGNTVQGAIEQLDAASGGGGADLAAHEADSLAVHGIADTAALETQAGAQAKVDAHVGDVDDAHDAAAVSVALAAGLAATNVQAALAELETEKETPAGAQAKVDAHQADTSAVHGIADTSLLETQAGAQAKVDAHVNDVADAHDASAVSFAPVVGANLAATNVQNALAELDTEKETPAGAQAKVDAHADDVTGVHGVGLSTVESVAGAQAKADAAETDAKQHADAADAAHVAAAADPHAAADYQTGAEVAATVEAHRADTTVVHGIADTAALETQSGAQAKVDAHVNDAVDAHDAAAISFALAAGFAATDVQAALVELEADKETPAGAQAKVDAHQADGTAVHGIADTSLLETQSGAQAKADAAEADAIAHADAQDAVHAAAAPAHAASGVSFSDTGLAVVTGVTNVQAALALVDAELDAASAALTGRFPVAEYGALADGITDDAAAIRAALAAAKAAGGGWALLEAGKTYRVDSTLVIDDDHVGLACPVGVGAYVFDNSSPAAIIKCGARLVGGAVVRMTGEVLGRRLFGGGVMGVGIHCGTTGTHADRGLELVSVAGAEFDVMITHVQAGGVGLLSTTNPAAAAQAGDTQENMFYRVAVRLTENHSGTCIRLESGAAGSNTSLNWWGEVSVLYGDGHGIDLANADNEFFTRIRGFRFAASTTGRCLVFRRDPTGGTNRARNNTFAFVQPTAGGVHFEGDDGGAANPPEHNHILSYSLDNGGIKATFDAGGENNPITYNTGVRAGEADAIFKRLTADFIINNTAILTPINELSFVGRSNGIYIVDYTLFVTGPDTADVQVALDVPTGATHEIGLDGIGPAVAGSTTVGSAQMAALTTDAGGEGRAIGTLATTPTVLRMRGLVTMGVAKGSITPMIRQNTAVVGDTTVRIKSFVEARRVS